MRTITFVLAFIFSGYGLATGQELEAYKNIPDGFEAIFPSPPTVTTTTFTTQYDYQLPTHVYTAMKGRERYSITVVDYTGIEKLAQERVKTCPPGAPLCKGTELGGFGLWKHDIRGAAEWAMLGLLKRDTKLTDMTWSQHDLVMGTELQMANPDQSRTYAYIAMHENRLYTPRSDDAQGIAARDAVPDLARVHRQERQRDSLFDDVHQLAARHARVSSAHARGRGSRSRCTRRWPRRPKRWRGRTVATTPLRTPAA